MIYNRKSYSPTHEIAMELLRQDIIVELNVRIILIAMYIMSCSPDDTSTTMFANTPENIRILRNERVELICKLETVTGIKIQYKSVIVIVENGTINEKFSDEFDFEIINETTGKLIIKHVTDEHQGTFKCGVDEIEKYASIEYVYTPINIEPLCKSSIESRFIFEDQNMEINCTSEGGYPPGVMTTYIMHGNDTNNIIDSSPTTSSHPYPSKTLSYRFSSNSSFNNSVFVCNVSQQLQPFPSYQGSCSFGPIQLLPLFSVSVTPSVITVNETDTNVILTCNSNVTEVNITWINISDDWEYNITSEHGYSELNIFKFSSEFNSVYVVCIGYYGDRNCSSKVHVVRQPRSRAPPRGVVILCVVLIIVVVVVCFVVLTFRKRMCFSNFKKRFKLKIRSSTIQNSSMNNSTDDNSLVNTPSRKAHTTLILEDVSGMVENTIYETYTGEENNIELSLKDGIAENSKEVQMVENRVCNADSSTASLQGEVNPLYDNVCNIFNRSLI